MKTLLKYLAKYKKLIVIAMIMKFSATGLELLIPYVLEHMIDVVAPQKDLKLIIIWGILMLLLAFAVRTVSVTANRRAVRIAGDCTYDIRKDLFFKTTSLSGGQVDEFGLPSLTSRMTADCYNVQNFMRATLTMGVRAPIMLIGGITVTMTMDTYLATILWIITPILVVLVIFLSAKGIPLYDKVQERLDDVVRIMRENISGIRVVKALSKEDYERNRFNQANWEMSRAERKAGIIMAMPGPTVTMFLNMSLTLVVLLGARRVNDGLTEPGVILAFLTYFNMILNAVNALNRLFINMSKANASSNRIAAVLSQPYEPAVISEAEAAKTSDEEFIVFDDVSFSYDEKNTKEAETSEGVDKTKAFNGEHRRKALEHISFKIKKGGSLGIIGATGCGKTTIVNLLMRFYDASEGHIFIGGKDIRTYDAKTLHSMFGVVFQNDVIFADSIAENISFGRDVSDDNLRSAAKDACGSQFIEAYEDMYAHQAAIKGANFSGGQKQRILIARALASHPDILVLDDSSSALDYRTDANVRNAVLNNYKDTTSVVIAQRISSVKNLDQVIILDEGKILGIGDHDYLMETCPKYAQIFEVQMGERA